jgi:hypothetical protein
VRATALLVPLARPAFDGGAAASTAEVTGATIAATYGFGAAFVTVGLAEVGIALLALPVLLGIDEPADRSEQAPRA